jgi:hypothetical protein
MNLEIIISGDMIKVSADWWWYLAITTLVILQSVLSVLKIKQMLLENKMKRAKK